MAYTLEFKVSDLDVEKIRYYCNCCIITDKKEAV